MYGGDTFSWVVVWQWCHAWTVGISLRNCHRLISGRKSCLIIERQVIFKRCVVSGWQILIFNIVYVLYLCLQMPAQAPACGMLDTHLLWVWCDRVLCRHWAVSHQYLRLSVCSCLHQKACLSSRLDAQVYLCTVSQRAHKGVKHHASHSWLHSIRVKKKPHCLLFPSDTGTGFNLHIAQKK